MQIDAPVIGKEKKRHPFLAVWLTLIIIFSVTFTVLYLSGVGVASQAGGAPGCAVPVLIILLGLQTVCAAALFRWRKWGFWGYCIVNVIGLVVDFWLGVSLIWPSVAVAVGIAGLYGALHVGQENKGWPQLE